MTDQNQMPMFEDPIPPQEAPVPPKKPRQKPTRKRKMPKSKKGAEMRMTAAKKRRKRRVAKPADSDVPKTKKNLRGMSMIEFIEVAVGVTMEPWQRRMIAAFLEKDK